jgi:hypothetical protein
MKIDSFDRTNLRLLSDDIKTALTAVAANYGITLQYKGARFSPDNVIIKIEGSTIGSGGVVNTRERDNFKLYASMYGLKETDLDKEISYAGKKYVIIGLNTRRSKYPIVAKRVADGKTILLTCEMVKSSLLRQMAVQLNPTPTPAIV